MNVNLWVKKDWPRINTDQEMDQTVVPTLLILFICVNLWPILFLTASKCRSISTRWRVFFAVVVGFEDKIAGCEEDALYFRVLVGFGTLRGDDEFVMFAGSRGANAEARTLVRA